MDACYGTLAILVVMGIVAAIVSVRNQRAQQRRQQGEWAGAQAQLQAQQAHGQWEHQQRLLRQAHAEQARRAELTASLDLGTLSRRADGTALF